MNHSPRRRARAPQLEPRPGWMRRAACARDDVDPDLFYGPTHERGGERRRRREAAALAVCAGCPVAADCLAYALATEPPSSRWGVWGATVPDTRAELRPPRRRRVAA